MTEADDRRLIQRKMPDAHWTPIESRLTGRGIADLNGCLHGVEVWIEVKRLEGKRKLRFRFPLKPSQANWLNKRWQAGGRVFIMARHINSPRIGLWTAKNAWDLARHGPEQVQPAWWFFTEESKVWEDIQKTIFQKTIFTYRT